MSVKITLRSLRFRLSSSLQNRQQQHITFRACVLISLNAVAGRIKTNFYFNVFTSILPLNINIKHRFSYSRSHCMCYCHALCPRSTITQSYFWAVTQNMTARNVDFWVVYVPGTFTPIHYNVAVGLQKFLINFSSVGLLSDLEPVFIPCTNCTFS